MLQLCGPGSDEDRDDEDDMEIPQGYCARYTGHVCRDYVSNEASIWFNVSSSDENGARLNEQLADGLWQDVVKMLQEPCRSAAKVTN